MNHSSSSEILIVGAGIVGLAAALALARQGLRVSLLGPREPLAPLQADVFDPRVYAISPASRDFLVQLGIWDSLPAERVCGVRTMDIVGDTAAKGRRSAGPAQLQLSAWQGGTDHLAWIVESRELERVLRQAVQWAGVPWTTEGFTSLDHNADGSGMTLHTTAGKALRASLAIAADGADSALRSAARLAVTRSDYHAMGLVVHLNASLPHQGCACQWFTPDGILALLPMPDTVDGPQVSMVWSMPVAQARALLALGESEQVAALDARLLQATDGRLGSLSVRSRLFGFPLILQNSEHLFGAGVVLVGDAAHVIHPLAGQGLNLGLSDVSVLAQTLAERESFRDVTDARVLRRYQRRRAEPLLAMRLVTDGLYRLFDTQAAPVAWLRNTGLSAVDRLPFLKRALVDAASGS